MKNTIQFSYEKNLHSNFYKLLTLLLIWFVSVGVSYGQTAKKPKKLKINGQEITHVERAQALTRSTCTRMPERTIDGMCNNISDMAFSSWGATDIELMRIMSPAYGTVDYFNDMGGSSRLSPRAISNIVVSQEEDLSSTRGLSSMVFTWGQFLDHDISLTPEAHIEYEPVVLPDDEPLFTQDIPFFRSAPMAGTGTDDHRQQQNIITSWIDASNVYGSEQSRADWLRTFTQGKLKMSTGDFLPYNTVNGEIDGSIDPDAPSMAGDGGGENLVFVAGDVRANEQPGLTSLHTLFVREHNRICEELVEGDLRDDEEIYQEARKQIGALIQVITYEEFLPALGVGLSDYNGYDAAVQPDISNLFATAAYRLGHTMVTEEIILLDEACEPVNGGSLALLDGFFRPSVIPENGIATFLQGLAVQTQQQVDTKIVDNLRNFLFPSNGGPAFGLDLASLNLQRGRDHGLPNYFATRAYYTGTVVTTFEELTSNLELQADLQTAYGSVYDMDVWIGLLAEDHLPGASVGMTLNAILGNQFANLRDGDFYYYENDPEISNLLELRRTSLAEVIIRNTAVENIQDNVFFAVECEIDDDGNGPGGNGPGGGGNGGIGPGGGNGNGGGNGGNGPRGGNGGGNGPGGRNGGNGNGGNGPGGNAIGQDLPNLGVIEEQNTSPQSFRISPNPTGGNITIDMLLSGSAEQAVILVQDMNGKQLLEESVSVFQNRVNHTLTLDEMVAGVYLITVHSGEEIFTEKVILE